MRKGFTLVELLVVISIIGILIALSVFGLQSARQSSRDAKRKADLELIRSGLEIYKSDCNLYPTSANFSLTSNSQLVGSGTPASCSSSNIYISQVATDPNPTQNYSYTSDGTTYALCAALETGGGTVTGCGSCGATVSCNYEVTNP